MPQGAWHGPEFGLLDSIDLRAISSQSIEGGNPEGVGFFVLDDSAPIPNNAILLQSNLYSRIPLTAANEAASLLGVSVGDFNQENLLDSIWTSLTDLADPTAVNRCKPLMPTVQGNIDLHLAGHSLVKREKFDRTLHPFVRDVAQKNAEMIRDTYLSRDQWRKYLGAMERKLGWQADQIIPFAESLAPETTISDDFTGADQDITLHTPSPSDWGSWMKDGGDADIVSNQASLAASTAVRANANLSTDDHSVEAGWVSVASSWLGVMARKDASSTLTYYMCFWRSVDNDVELFRRVSGAFTQLGADLNSSRAEPSTSIGISVDGSTIEGFVDGVSEGTRTDTNITGNLQAGMTSSGAGVLDDYVSVDLVVSGRIMSSLVAAGGLAGLGGIAGKGGGLAG